jgi:hypothetical protein
MARDSQGYPPGRIVSKLILAYAINQENDLESALLLAKEALDEARGISDNVLICRCLRINAWLLTTGAVDSESMSDTLRERLELGHALSLECLSKLPLTSSHLTFEQLTLCYIYSYLDMPKESYEWLKRAQKTALRHGMRSMLLFAFRFECLTAFRQGNLDHSALLFGVYQQIRENTGYNPMHSLDETEPYAGLAARLTDPRYQEFVKKGRETPPEQLAAMSIPIA